MGAVESSPLVLASLVISRRKAEPYTVSPYVPRIVCVEDRLTGLLSQAYSVPEFERALNNKG